jgi:glycosyltransferase involved in cell wall biosynthesis
MAILFFHTGDSPFGSKDISIFKEIEETKVFCFSSKSKLGTPLLFIQQKLFILKNLFNTSIYISQFAGYHSFLPGIFARLTGKPHLIISGGTDCVSFPGIGYGNFYKTFLGLFTKWSFQLATYIAPKHESLWMYEYSYDKNEPAKQGIKAFVPKLKTAHTVITNGYDYEKWKPTNVDRLPKSFITVSGGFQFPFQVALKGIDLILEVAPHFPDCTFKILGFPEWKKLEIKSSNVIILPPTKNDDLIEVYSKHQYYLQLSMAEGFPNALCESMLCGCIPIVSDVFSMPEIIGDSGYVLKERNIDQLKSLILNALKDPSSIKSELARNRIKENYTLTERKDALIGLILSLKK